MRLAGGLMLAVLALPSYVAVPLLDEGPIAFSYEFVHVEPLSRPTQVSVAADLGNLGIGFATRSREGNFLTKMIAYDGGFTSVHTVSGQSYTAGVFDSAGNLHIAWSRNLFSPVREEVFVSKFDGASWTDNSLFVVGAAFPEAAFTIDAVPYIVFSVNPTSSSSDFRPFVYKLDEATGDWSLVTDYGKKAIIGNVKPDSAGRIHMVSLQGGARVHSVFENGAWVDEAAPCTAAWTGCTLAIGPDDKVYYAYGDSSRRPHVLIPTATGYVDELVSTAGLGDNPEIEVDPSGDVHLLTYYYTGNFDTPTGSSAYYSRRAIGGGWMSQLLLPQSQLGADQTLDEDGNVVIALPNHKTQTIVGTEADHASASIAIARPLARFLTGPPEGTLP